MGKAVRKIILCAEALRILVRLRRDPAAIDLADYTRHQREMHLPPDPWPKPRTIIRAVEVVSRSLPWETTCLQRAVVATKILRRLGFPARVSIGLDPESATLSGYFAHAWVVVGEDHSEVGYLAFSATPS